MTAAYVLSGFLGAGKTSLLQHILNAGVGPDTVVLVNEFGQLGLDGQLLQRDGLVVHELRSGCICCTINDALGRTLTDIQARYAPRNILIEASGVADPANIVKTTQAAGVAGQQIKRIAVLDARMWPRRALLGHLFQAQLEQADLLVINKPDLIAAAALPDLTAAVQSAFPRATVCVARHGAIPVELFWQALAHGLPSGLQPCVGHETTHPAFMSLAFTEPGAMRRERLEALLAEPPAGLLRAKGSVVLEEGLAYLDFVDGQVVWSQPPAGMRETCLTFIGTAFDALALQERLRAMRKTPAEPQVQRG